MKYRFAVIDDEIGLTVGYCRDVIGLTGNIIVETYEKVIFEQFVFNEEFIENIISFTSKMAYCICAM
ncbi:hypothetical protein MF628_001061 [Paenibacillus polymyxa]|uniref:hypothetical protein n=1 Tax=Paenibacillus polymyxa TaxID=1406 RepID=UPI00202409F8|nr:hypothetical protein [Paenibacillus polymyxa]URJ46516.1 hypothetical protein MF628_001061 [Paenibacillus polymyxa]